MTRPGTSTSIIPIIDLALCDILGLNPADIATSAVEAGCTLAILRGRRSDDDTLSDVLRHLFPHRNQGLRILVAPAPGTASGAPWLRFCDGVHLTGNDPHFERPANRHAPFLVSRSAHVPEHQPPAQKLLDMLDMQTVSPIFRPSYKGSDEPVDALGLDGLARFTARATAPTWALGGIGPDNIRAVVASGAAGAAIMGPLHVPDHAQRTELLRSLVQLTTRSAMN